jgi:tetratricopeptide (TPR) repeat protein
MNSECTSARGSNRTRPAGLSLASLVALAALAAACTTTTPASGTVDPVDQKPADALAEYEEAVRVDPTNADLWLGLGQLYEQKGRGEDALHSLEKGLEADPGNAGILNHMAWFYATTEDPKLRDPAKALSYAQRAVEASNGMDANVLDTLAEAHFVNGEFDEAIEAEEKALGLAPGREAYLNQLEKFRAAKAAESGR